MLSRALSISKKTPPLPPTAKAAKTKNLTTPITPKKMKSNWPRRKKRTWAKMSTITSCEKLLLIRLPKMSPMRIWASSCSWRKKPFLTWSSSSLYFTTESSAINPKTKTVSGRGATRGSIHKLIGINWTMRSGKLYTSCLSTPSSLTLIFRKWFITLSIISNGMWNQFKTKKSQIGSKIKKGAKDLGPLITETKGTKETEGNIETKTITIKKIRTILAIAITNKRTLTTILIRNRSTIMIKMFKNMFQALS